MSELPDSLKAFGEAISADNPCGENLEYDAAFLELMRTAEGTPETVMGDSVIPGEEPNWREVRSASMELLGRSRDMRLVLVLTLALLKQEGLPGLRDGLGLMRRLMEQFWDTGLHPQLDPDDNNDPTFRLNVLSSLAAPPGTFGDPWKFQQRVRETPLADSRSLGRFGLADIAVANGTEEAVNWPADKPKPDPQVIQAAFAEMPPEALATLKSAAEQSVEHIKAIDGVVNTKVGGGRGPDLAGFRQLLQECVKQISKGVGGGSEAGGAESGGGAGGGAGGGRREALSGEVMSSGDALVAMDKVIRYYETFEPSSPVPLIVKGAKRMVGKNFLEITKILTPDAVSVMERLIAEDTPT